MLFPGNGGRHPQWSTKMTQVGQKIESSWSKLDLVSLFISNFSVFKKKTINLVNRPTTWSIIWPTDQPLGQKSGQLTNHLVIKWQNNIFIKAIKPF